MRFRRRPFADLIARQLDLFEEEHAGLLRDAERALAAYNEAPKDEAEERYGDFRDLAAEGEELLADLRDAYAATLEDETAERYREEFDREVRRRLPRFGLDLL
jgi:rubrerythrin